MSEEMSKQEINYAIYATQEGKSKLEVILKDETIWLNQKQVVEDKS